MGEEVRSWERLTEERFVQAAAAYAHLKGAGSDQAKAELEPLHADLHVLYGPDDESTLEVGDLLARLRIAGHGRAARGEWLGTVAPVTSTRQA
ncbi:hypothetical protein [Micromonospora sp. LOL_023]|uniref:hypothetical protein n=1 Tax=Micromonospora sp. LOL_023 TaxID=3345418 RepID=UPI003A8AE33C